MPLVDYASSDEGSENECEVEGEKKENSEAKEKDLKTSTDVITNHDKVNDNSNEELFNSLPKPRKTFSFLEDDNKLSKLLLNKNSLSAGRKDSVKISVPSVSDFEDTEQPAPKKLKPSAKGTGLFSILPPPKNTSMKQTIRNLVPHVLSKNPVKSTASKTQTQSKFFKNTLGRGVNTDEDDEDDTAVGTSFFGNSLMQENSHSDSKELQSENNVIEENSFVNELPSTVQNCNLDLVLPKDNYSCPTEAFKESETVVATDNPLDLDEKALQILCGNKKKRQHMPMNVIDLSSEEVLPDSKEWLLKQFTEEKRVRSHSHKKNQGPSSQSRRKHQITYLAYQAKEQELELQNQWANNRMSRKQTQSKYGF